jgi:hypothetical protein
MVWFASDSAGSLGYAISSSFTPSAAPFFFLFLFFFLLPDLLCCVVSYSDDGGISRVEAFGLDSLTLLYIFS